MALSYCGMLARDHDPERFLCALYAPEALREHLFTLIAFNHEVAKTAETVSEPMLGQIRLQWWRDAITEIHAGRPRAHAVVSALAATCEEHQLERERLDAIIDARESDLDEDFPRTISQLEQYAAATSAGFLELWLSVLLGGERAPDDPNKAAARHIGIAWALTGLLRAARVHAARRVLFLPREELDRHGVRLGDYFECRGSAALERVAADIARRATEHLAHAEIGRAECDRRALPALLMATLTRGHLRRLARRNHDILARETARAGVLGQLALHARAISGRW